MTGLFRYLQCRGTWGLRIISLEETGGWTGVGFVEEHDTI
jgi:hypothetical protein